MSQILKGNFDHHLKILETHTFVMVGPQDGGFGFDQSKKYSSIENIEQVCVQCQAGQHAKCLAKSKQIPSCECEHCIVFG
jgi:hypothetical protein